jgi:hypothetical protein
MVTSLADGLSAAGASIATKGREGGAPMVQQLQEGRQQQAIQAQQAEQAKKNADLQNQLTNASIVHTVALTHQLLGTMQSEIDSAAVKVKSEQFALGKEQADYSQGHAGLQPDEWREEMKKPLFGSSGQPGQTGQDGQPAMTKGQSLVLSNAQQALGFASQAGLDEKDPFVHRLKGMIAPGSNATAGDVEVGIEQLKSQQAGQSVATKEKSEKEAAAANSPVAKLSSPEALMSPGAVEAIQAKIDDPKTDPADLPRFQALIPRAQLALANAEKVKSDEEAMRQSITDGDPKAAGALLFSGSVSPKQLVSSRKPQFAQQAFDEAVRLGGAVKDADGKWSGGTWTAAKADAQFDYAINPKTQNTLNLLTTMQDKGGSIDIAQNAFNALPEKASVVTLNKILTGVSAEVGGVGIPKFKAAMVSLQDEYAQVLQGGAATETTLKQAADLILAAYTKEQGAGAFDTIRLDMAQRQKGMVRDNPTLMSMYPDKKAAPAGDDGNPVGTIIKSPKAPTGATSEVVVQGKVVGHTVNKTFVPLGQ